MLYLHVQMYMYMYKESEMNFHYKFLKFMKQVVYFFIPEPLARGYKTHNGFHRYRNENSFQFLFIMLNLQKREKSKDLSSFITDFSVENVLM